MTDATPSERRISAITDVLSNLLRDCPPAEAVAALEIVLARARERAGMGKPAVSVRKAFQDWFEAHGYPGEHSKLFALDADGDYEIDETHLAWRVWQAARERGLRARAEEG